MHEYCMKMWEPIISTHVVILSGHTEFLVQVLLMYYNSTQSLIWIQPGIQAL